MWFKPKKTNSINSQIIDHDMAQLPDHIAIIMDGNGRWAKKRGLPRSVGHRAGVEALRNVVKTCSQLGVKVLTVYAFSTENWKRPKDEVGVLMTLLTEYLRKELNELHENDVIVRSLGGIAQLPAEAQKELHNAFIKTKENKGLILNLALNYGGRNELVQAVRLICADVKNNKIIIDNINEDLFSQYLFTAGLPDPDLLIRTSGEMRLSNFLLWQLAYTEIVVVEKLWPDFNKEDLLKAIESYQKRERRFGGLIKDKE